jgi:hypothetical protein
MLIQNRKDSQECRKAQEHGFEISNFLEYSRFLQALEQVVGEKDFEPSLGHNGKVVLERVGVKGGDSEFRS